MPSDTHRGVPIYWDLLPAGYYILLGIREHPKGHGYPPGSSLYTTREPTTFLPSPAGVLYTSQNTLKGSIIEYYYYGACIQDVTQSAYNHDIHRRVRTRLYFGSKEGEGPGRGRGLGWRANIYFSSNLSEQLMGVKTVLSIFLGSDIVIYGSIRIITTEKGSARHRAYPCTGLRG